MKILVMTSLYPPCFIGGAELSCREHVAELQKRGHDVSVLTSWWGLDAPVSDGNIYRRLNYADAGLEKHADKSRDALRLRRRYNQLRRAILLSRNYEITRTVVEDAQPDVVYAWHMESVSISPLLAAQDLGVPIVIRLPDYWLSRMKTEICLESNILKRWYRAMLTGLGGFARLDTSHMLAVGSALMQNYIEAGFSAESIQVIPEGVPFASLFDTSQRLAFQGPNSRKDFKLLFVGRLVNEKAPDIAIRTLSYLVTELGLEQATLDFVGEGPGDYENSLRNMIADLGLKDKVTFVGKLDRAQVIELYSRYSVLLFPSRWVEPFGLGVIEAMARGLPVIAVNSGGPMEIIVNEENGILVPPEDPVAMAKAIQKLASNPELAQRIRENAMARIRDNYTNEQIIGQVEKYLQTVLEQRKG